MERTMIKFIWDYMKTIPDTKIETDKYGNLYITKGESETYPCIAAHLDQVQRFHSKDFIAIETKDIIVGYSASTRRQEGLGADDKNGIWIALKCLEKYDILKAAFFVGEEVGCAGSSKARMDFFGDCRFVIEPDRKGYRDLITTICRTSLCSGEFLKDTGYGSFGYQETDGMMTDIQALKERGLGISCINLSCGYYEPHTDHEFTVKKDLLKCLGLVEYIIENCTKVYPHQADTNRNRKNPDYPFGEDYDEFEEAWDEIFEILELDPDLTADDVYDMYQTNFPSLGKEDFEQIYNEYFEYKTIKQQRLWETGCM